MHRILLISFLLAGFTAKSQLRYVIDQTIPIQDLQGNTLNMPWGGGLNAAQYNTMDINNDNKEDLVLFDRMANKLITFLNENNEHYIYAPEYETLFPSTVTNWLLLRDYNNDGKKDIFTGDVFGIKVFTNITAPDENLSWRQFSFYSGFPNEPKSNVILTKGFSGKINLQIQFDDLPAIIDADNDGDLDIFNFRYSGGGTVEYHQNFSQEKYGNADSLDFERITQSWGNFRECACAIVAFDNADCPTNGRVQHAGGKSLLVLDVNADQQLDLVFSESQCTKLYTLLNEGTLSSPDINFLSEFPALNSVDFELFPAAFFEDVDFDGKKDLIASPNVFTKENLNINFQQSNWFYKNTGSTSKPIFSLLQKDFLQDQMIDAGDNAVPAFFDFDGDGDQDLFISRNYGSNYSSTLLLYENIGSPSLPAFKLVTSDYLNFSETGLYNLKIQFIDINNDNRKDLVFTATSAFTGVTQLYYIHNKSNSGLNLEIWQAIETNFTLAYTENICLTTINNDGLPDLLFGRSTGALQYWKNTGTAEAPNFTLENGSFLGLGSSVERQNLSCYVDDVDDNGKADLMLGDQSGVLKIVTDYLEAVSATPQTDFIFNPLTKTYSKQNLGGRIWPTTATLFSGHPSIIIGNVLGGISILKNEMEFGIYPNPVFQSDLLKIKIDRPYTLQVYTSTGQHVGEKHLVQSDYTFSFNVTNLAPGLYFFKFTSTNKSFVRKIVIN
jgi:hypothetical protein